MDPGLSCHAPSAVTRPGFHLDKGDAARRVHPVQKKTFWFGGCGLQRARLPDLGLDELRCVGRRARKILLSLSGG